jgi:hypothetical protein
LQSIATEALFEPPSRVVGAKETSIQFSACVWRVACVVRVHVVCVVCVVCVVRVVRVVCAVCAVRAVRAVCVVCVVRVVCGHFIHLLK